MHVAVVIVSTKHRKRFEQREAKSGTTLQRNSSALMRWARDC